MTMTLAGRSRTILVEPLEHPARAPRAVPVPPAAAAGTEPPRHARASVAADQPGAREPSPRRLPAPAR
jgi:hypothetical protein